MAGVLAPGLRQLGAVGRVVFVGCCCAAFHASNALQGRGSTIHAAPLTPSFVAGGHALASVSQRVSHLAAIVLVHAVVDDAGEFRTQLSAVDDAIDESVLQQEFAGLEIIR